MVQKVLRILGTVLGVFNVVRNVRDVNNKISERRQRERADIRRAILDAARDLFVREGYEAVSMRKIADAIEYTPTAIYYHFKDKDKILQHLISEGFGMLRTRLNQAQNDDPVERLRAGGQIYLRFAFENPQYYTIMFEMKNTPHFKQEPPADDAAHEAFGFIVRCVTEGVAQGVFTARIPQPILSHVVLATCHGAASLALSGRLDMMPPEMHETFFETVLDQCLRGLARG